MKQLIIRISEQSMAFATAHYDEADKIEFEPFHLRNGISAAANLREAFKSSPLLSRHYDHVEVMVNSPVLLVPLDEFQEEEAPVLYRHTYLGHDDEDIAHVIIAELYSVAVFALQKDLKTVVEDHFTDIHYQPVSLPVWRHLRIEANNGQRKKLFAYFHDKQVEMFYSWQNRVKFYNTFQTAEEYDSLYYLLYVWRQTGLNAETDELRLVGEIPHEEWLTERLRHFLRNVSVINPSDNHTKDMPYDMGLME
ncbi:MAG: DUF3822 family protein [Prevotella sp.]|nr:DUF3822 family protein [Prevotella sp.]